MFPFPKRNEFQNTQPTTENSTLLKPEENPEPILEDTPVEVKKKKKNFNWKLFLKSQNPNLESINEDIENGIELLDKKVDKLPLTEKSNKCVHSFLKIVKYTFVFIFALFAILSFLMHFQKDAPKIIEKTKCLFDESCDLPDLLEVQNLKTNSDQLENELPNAKTYIYPNTFDEFKTVVNKFPENTTLFQNEFYKKQV